MKLLKLKHRIPRYKKGDSITEEFFEFFKNCFFKGTPVEIIYENGIDDFKYDDYVRDLYFSIEANYYELDGLGYFYEQYRNFKKAYSVYFRWGCYESFVEFLIREKRYNEALEEWIILRDEEMWHNTYTYRDSELLFLMRIENLLCESTINGYILERIATKGNQLTAFGRRNIIDIHEVLTKIILTNFNLSFFEQFYMDYSYNSKRRKTFDFLYYEKYFQHNSNSKKVWEWIFKNIDGSSILKNGNAAAHVAIEAIKSEAGRLLREAENSYRIAIGSKKIGEAWISETELYYKIKNHLSTYEVIQHGRPDWLGRQHFDVWIPELNVALEFQGAQHDKPIEFFGGQKAFEQNQKRDQLKKEKCLKNGIRLIEVREGYNFNTLIKEIGLNN